MKTFFKSLVGAAALTLGMAASASASAETTLVVGTWQPPGNPMNTIVWPTWAEWVEEATEGRVKVKIEQDVGHPKTYFQLVEDGVINAGWSYHGYVPGRFKLPIAVEQPGLGVSAEAASVALWRVQEKYFADAGEFEGLTLLAMLTHGPGQIHSIDPINSLADLKGKKIRIGGGVQTEIGERIGITPVAAPGSKVYEMMQQGVIDGVFMPVTEQKALRLTEVAPNLTVLPGGMYLGSFSMFIDPYFLEELDPKDAEAIMSVSGEKLSALAGRAWDEADKEGFEAARAAGVTINDLTADSALVQEFNELIKGMDDAWIESVSDRGVDARAALEELRSIAREYEAQKQE
ncbi:C4-dicarboxylate ABC transporter substrate-binding protein [Marinobacterium iners]|jgi:TRAP-type C4-dicarboxylate transport system substrate-binding protein|uniref:TRAP-type C4-dicarboxylate transport system, substrate-binding protein n=1 Tax=Marinobacterium iners DSM 11526 TaxID=1122198 RepID=A0A1H4H055_9GAMM|nr:TRAP transporter substrate-binding protein [Marinobacterium iners]QSR34250.1 C4-dicarboxylate ABC transporter substrate-binding protein [Marinobacterium iners]SEB15227.1 TRAP-type C4-dicarboxylate transport system, substrate-binding protein [Marinobacterium iners DSM 11526]